MRRTPRLVSPFSNTDSHCGNTPAPHLPSERDWLRPAGGVRIGDGEDLRVVLPTMSQHPDVFMSHRYARLTIEGGRLLVKRSSVEGMPVTHLAAMMGVIWQRPDRWVRRFDARHPSGPTGASTRRSPTRRVCSRTAIPVAAISATSASLARSAADGCGVLHAVRRSPNTIRAR